MHNVLPAFTAPWLELLLAATAPGGDDPSAPAPPDFRPYIFWAYGAVCLLLLAFTLWTLLQVRGVGRQVEYLTERFERAHPGEGESPQG